MPFEIIRGDITELNVDAAVNAAGPVRTDGGRGLAGFDRAAFDQPLIGA